MGLIDRAIDRCIVYFSGSGQNTYATETLTYKWLLDIDATIERLKRAIYNNTLVNLTGTRDGFYPKDLLLEHANGEHKEVLKQRRMATFDLYSLFYETAVLTGYNSLLRTTFSHAFDVHITGRHTSPKHTSEIFMIGGELARKSIKEMPSKASYDAPDFLANGIKQLGVKGGLKKFNTRMANAADIMNQDPNADTEDEDILLDNIESHIEADFDIAVEDV